MFTAMVSSPTAITRDQNKKIVKIIQTLLAYQQSNIFRKPIPHKSLGWQDYKQIVKKPTDLNYVRRQYNEGKYKYVEEVLDQIQLVWDNVFMYNKRDHQSYDLALKMLKYFDQLINDLLPEYYQKINRPLYFKQFQKVIKPQKKLSLQKNNKKVQKMDIQPIKQQIKIDPQPEYMFSKKRQSFNSRRAENISIQKPQILNAQNKQIQKKVEVNLKPIETKKATNNQNNSNQQNMQQTLDKFTTLKANTQSKFSNPLIENKQNKIQQINEQKVVQATNIVQGPIQGSLVIPLPQLIQNQQSEQNKIAPIMVNLNKCPCIQQINEISNMMNLLFQIGEYETLSRIVKILTQYEKQNMIIDGEDVNFRMNQIHISTYNRIRKQLINKINHIQESQKIKNFHLMKNKFNVIQEDKLINNNLLENQYQEQKFENMKNQI